MRRNRAFHIGNGVTPPSDKATALGARYIGWWRYAGHRQNTDVVEFYEKSDGSDTRTW